MKNINNEQATLKQEYMTVIASEVWGNDEGMLKHISKGIARIIKTEKGYLIPVEKPSIKTDFCFGYSLSSYDSEDFDRANEMADHARRSEEYFKEENLKQIKEWFKPLENDELYICKHYWKSPADTKAKTIVHKRYWEFDRMTEEQKKEYEPISEADKAIIREAYEIELAAFEKRLDTYLKRYGTSKLRTWSYWQDA